jgi:hypothetical protein
MNNFYVVISFWVGQDSDDCREWNRYYGPYTAVEAEQIRSEILRLDLAEELNPPMDTAEVLIEIGKETLSLMVVVEQIEPKTATEVLSLTRKAVADLKERAGLNPIKT